MPRPLDEQLADADVFISNAQADDEITAAFARVNRDAAYFADGQTRLDEARRLHQKQKAEYGEQYEATDELHRQKAEATDVYTDHLDLARLALEEDLAAQEALRLSGRRHRRLDAWIDQVQGFYDNLTATGAPSEAWQQALAGYGVTEEDLTAAQSEVQDVVEARRAQARETGEAQQATEAREEAFDDLDAWLDEARRLARVVLKGQRQKLEELGILARSA